MGKQLWAFIGSSETVCQLRFLINWPRFCSERASQTGRHLPESWAQVTYFPSLLSNLTSNKNNLFFITCAPQTNRLVSSLSWHYMFHIQFNQVFQPPTHVICLCVVLPKLSVQTPLLFHSHVFEIVKSQLPEVWFHWYNTYVWLFSANYDLQSLGGM